MTSIFDFISTSERLLTFDSKFKEENQTEGSLHLYKSELQEMWNACRDAYEAALAETCEPKGGSSTKTSETNTKEDYDAITYKYISTFETYALLFGRITDMLKQFEPPDPSASIVSKTKSSHDFKLPPCEIEMFHGDYLSWPTFRDLFTAVYIKNTRLSNVEKLYHLLHKTKGDANLLIKRVPLTNEGFDLAWSHLMQAYENKRVLTNTQLEIFYKLESVRIETSESLKTLQRNICSVLESLTLLGVDISSWDPIIVFHCCQRLPENTLTLWEQTVADKASIPSWESLNTFLTARHQTLESVAGMRATTVPKPIKTVSTQASKHLRVHHANINSMNAKNKCSLCQASHRIRTCDKFKAMTALQRYDFVKSKGMCINCLDSTHTVSACSSQFTCAICTLRHHTMLHFKEPLRRPVNISNSQATDKDHAQPHIDQAGTSTAAHVNQSFHQLKHNTCSNYSTKSVLLGTANVLVSHLDTSYPVRALIDSASEVSFISNNLRKRLNLPTRPVIATVSGVNEQITASSSKLCSLTLKSLIDEQFHLECDALVLSKITGNLPSLSVEAVDTLAIPEFQLADAEFYKSAPVDMLIGGDLYASVVLSGVQLKVLGSLIAQETVFGWILTGIFSSRNVCSYATTVTIPAETSVDIQLQKFWEVEEVPQKKHLSEADTYCETLFKRTTWRQNDGRFVVTLPFKPEFSSEYPLGVSRPMVLKQFIRNEANLLKRLDFKSNYDAVLREYIELNHMEKVSPPSIEESSNCFYLPHHPVIKPESTTTSLRVVFNASSATSNGRSLNDVLYTGPVLQSDLTFLLLQWRLYRYVLNSDITKMYRQILVEPSQRKFQRILFRSDHEESIQDFELKTVTFGVNCAPFLAIRTLHKLAEDVFYSHPLASKILRKNMYVDDVLAGFHDISTAQLARDQLIDALSTAGFSLRKWASNNRRILEGLPREHLLNESFLQFEDVSSSKTLGVRWNAVRDDFYFSTEAIVWKDDFTKREVLSIIAKLFDPAGWLGPFIITAKIIMQQIWLDKTKWDDILLPDTMTKWRSFVNDYPLLNDIRIPRWIGFHKKQFVQIHGFCDASEKAFAGAVYIRCEQFGAIFTHLFMAKTKVAPVKTVSLPRLELCGAFLLSQMLTTLLSEIKFESFEVFCWTDSTIVLSWLQKPPCTWTTFVANRVAKIQERVGAQCWRHVESKDNPADLGSRGMQAFDLKNNSLWWNGPAWLPLCSDEWPSPTPPTSDMTLEAKAPKTHAAVGFSISEDLLERFSDFSRAARVMAYILRFLNASRKRIIPHDLFITSTEIKAVKMCLIKSCQKQYFTSEYTSLMKQTHIPKKSPLLTLNPVLDTDGVMRINGRLIHSRSLTFAEKNPILLPYNARFSKLLIQFIHTLSLHGGNKLVLRLLRQEFWIPKASNLIKTVINHCKPCLLYKHKQSTQIMAALPIERSTLSRPFEVTGIDFAGPFDIKNYAGRACLITKGYVCVFVCFSTKAIHLEGTSSLSTECFLAAFARFVSRRGCPKKVFSDNGTTFVGASKNLRKDFEDTMKEVSSQVISRYILQAVSWNFIPAGAPHMGGLWEAGVKAFKAHFRKTVANFKFTFEEFSTLLSRIEACLNSRPLCSGPDNNSEIVALTPGHFLIGTPILAPAETLSAEQPMTIRNRWRRVQILSQTISLRWKEEYLKELHKRFKWKHPTKNFEIDDIVVVRHENLPPTEWRLGRIVKISPGKDNRVRVADIRTQRGVITRPIVKLVSLPSDES